MSFFPVHAEKQATCQQDGEFFFMLFLLKIKNIVYLVALVMIYFLLFYFIGFLLSFPGWWEEEGAKLRRVNITSKYLGRRGRSRNFGFLMIPEWS